MTQVTFSVNGETIGFDFSDLEIVDTDDLRSKSAAAIAYWSSVVADAEQDLEMMEVEKANWYGKAVAIALKSPDAGSSEWKVKAAIAAQGECLKRDQAMVRQRNTVSKVKAVLVGFQKQHDLLKAMTLSSGTDGSRAADIGRTNDNRMDKFREERARRSKSNGE
jgi:hypothetical protein